MKQNKNMQMENCSNKSNCQKKSGKGRNGYGKGKRANKETDRRNSDDQVTKGSVGKPEATHNLKTQDVKCNDPVWYMGGPAGPIPFNVPFSEPTGANMRLQTAPRNNYNTSGLSTVVYSMPGIMAMEFVPTYGRMASPSDPINMSLTRLHTMLRYGQSYSHTYDAAHLGAHLIMADQLFMLIAHLRRAYGLMRWYSSVNQHMPDEYVRALGFDHASLSSNQLEDFRQYINTLVRKVAMLKVPANWKLFLRHQFMCETIYMDTPSVKTQMYAFVPAFFYKYVVNKEAGSWALEPVKWSAYNTARDLEAIKTYCDSIVNSYVFQEDAVIISADMLRIYGNDGCYKLFEIDPNYVTQPVYDTTILAQIHNATVWGYSYSSAYCTPEFKITQNTDDGSLRNLCSITVSNNNISALGGCLFTRVLDAPIDGADANYVAEATRLMSYAACACGDNGTTFTFMGGTEIITSAIVWYKQDGNVTSINAYTSSGDVTLTLLSKFLNAPLLYKTSGSIANKLLSYTMSALIGNVDNYAYVTNEMLDTMHLNALYSLYDVPVLDSAKVTY